MYILKQLRKSLSSFLFNYFQQSVEYTWWSTKWDDKTQKSEKLSSVEDIKNIEQLKSEISDFLKDEVVKKYLKDDLKDKIKEKLNKPQKTPKYVETLSVILRELKNIKENWEFLEKEKAKAEKNQKLKEKLEYAKIEWYKEHLEAVLEAENMICEALWQCEWIEEAKSELQEVTKEQTTELSKEIEALKLTQEQKNKIDKYYKALDEDEKQKFVDMIKNKPEEVKNLIKLVEDMSSKENQQRLTQILKEKKEKYKDNPEVLERIKKLEEELKAGILMYIGKNNDYAKLFNPIFENSAWDISQEIIALEKLNQKIWNIEVALKTMESKEEKAKRYEWLEKEYEKVKEVEEFKDIIWEKKFDELTAGDFYAMLKTNPEKVRNLLLATSNWETVNIAWNWEAYKNKVLKVNFGKNKWLDQIIWAGDILDIYQVKTVEINWVKWTRWFTPRPGYYTESWRYLAIHDWYTVKITEVWEVTEEERKKFEQAKQKRFDEIRWAEIKKSLESIIKEEIAKNKDAKEIKIPYKAKVDRDYIERFIKKPENEYLGLEISEEWVLKVWEDFNIGHLWEALNWYSKTKSKIKDYLEKHKDLSENKQVTLSISELWLDSNHEFLENALKNIVNNDKVQITIDWDSIVIDSSDTEKTIWNLFSTFESKEYTVQEFFTKAKEISARIEEKYGIPRQVVLWMSLLESGNGQSKLTRLGNNAFWHKARAWEKSIAMMTWEYRWGTYGMEMANFRAFNNIEESFEAYAKLLTGASRYRRAFAYKDDPERFLYEIIRAWYATLAPSKYVANVKARLRHFWESLS